MLWRPRRSRRTRCTAIYKRKRCSIWNANLLRIVFTTLSDDTRIRIIRRTIACRQPRHASPESTTDALVLQVFVADPWGTAIHLLGTRICTPSSVRVHTPQMTLITPTDQGTFTGKKCSALYTEKQQLPSLKGPFQKEQTQFAFKFSKSLDRHGRKATYLSQKKAKGGPRTKGQRRQKGSGRFVSSESLVTAKSSLLMFAPEVIITSILARLKTEHWQHCTLASGQFHLAGTRCQV